MLKISGFVIALVLVAAALSGSDNASLSVLLARGAARGYPGLAMIIERADGSTESAAAGYSNLEHRTAMRISDAFHMASITKTFTAAAVLRLVDEGKLRMDATVASLLGDAVASIPNSERITLAQLLDHSSGIYPTNNDMDYLKTLIGMEADPQRVWKPEEFIALAHRDRQKPAGEPGAGHFYSDTNYILLGMIVDKVTGIPFKQHVTETLLKPLGMSSTYFYSDYLNPKSVPPVKTVQGYLLATPELRKIISIHPSFGKVSTMKEGELLNTTKAAERIDAAGGLVTTLPDLMKFASALFRGKLLSPSSQKFLFAADEGMREQPVGTQRIYALQSIRKDFGVLLYKEGDGPGGVNTLMAYDPSRDQIYVSFTNSFGHFNEIDFFMDEVIAMTFQR
jgi:D-alanyl-D-alanine carboxypeptidase